ncbi:MAG: 16S rRNA (guanine(966)-N(2))-methyltransferase RsmD [Eggerthellaceae bacterium]|nr:16S rRNA (guanine(966)-N(2))-methyltransferase RsmD [Eggerthellaceae bacterium]
MSVPEGSNTRPTTDRVREALFSSLYSMLGGFEGHVVLDAFAGSGALGIEALSRGADSALFYESDARTVKSLRRNIDSLGLGPDAARVVAKDVLASPPRNLSNPITLLFADPPYSYDPAVVLGMVAQLKDYGCLAEDAVIVYEHALKSASEVESAARSVGFDVVSSRKYGKTGITIVECREGYDIDRDEESA